MEEMPKSECPSFFDVAPQVIALALQSREDWRLVTCQAPPTASITLSVMGIVIRSKSTAPLECPEIHLTARGLTQPM